MNTWPDPDPSTCAGEGSPEHTHGHVDLCDDNGWDHPGPCIAETDLE